MNLLRLDSPDATAVSLAYSGDQYLRYYFSYTFVSGTLGNNWCRCVSNEKTGIATTFLKHQCLCSVAYFAMCEFKFPRGKKMKFATKTQAQLNYIYFKLRRSVTSNETSRTQMESTKKACAQSIRT